MLIPTAATKAGPNAVEPVSSKSNNFFIKASFVSLIPFAT